MVSSSVVLLNRVLGLSRWQLFDDFFCTKDGDRSNIAVDHYWEPFSFQKTLKLQMQKQLLHVIQAPYELKLAKSACITSLAYLLEIESFSEIVAEVLSAHWVVILHPSVSMCLSWRAVELRASIVIWVVCLLFYCAYNICICHYTYSILLTCFLIFKQVDGWMFLTAIRDSSENFFVFFFFGHKTK